MDWTRVNDIAVKHRVIRADVFRGNRLISINYQSRRCINILNFMIYSHVGMPLHGLKIHVHLVSNTPDLSHLLTMVDSI